MSTPAPTWAEVQAAIQAWIVEATGIAAARVRWADQGGAQPDSSGGAWVSLSVLADETTGQPWVDVEDAASPATGAEVEHIARSANAGTLSIQVIGAAAVGNSSALALLRRLRPALGLPVVAALTRGVVGFGEFEPARSVPALINATYFEPRGVMSCRFFTAAELRATTAGTATGTYIESTEITGVVEP